MNILLLDISGSERLRTNVSTFFGDRPAHLEVVTDLNLFKTLSKSTKRFACAIALVNSGNAPLVNRKHLIPTTVYQPHTFTYKNLRQFYREQGGNDG